MEAIAWVCIFIAFACAFVVAVDEIRHPQKMWIMNLVWPITALYFSVFAVWAYFDLGRKASRDAAGPGAMPGMDMDEGRDYAHSSMVHSSGVHKKERQQATWRQTAVATSHCGAGCTLGDIIAEFSLFALGFTFFGSMLYASFAADLSLAWLLGIVFQYFTIKPMRNLSPAQALLAALKADTLSILAFEVGLFGWMALTYLIFFPNPHLKPTQPLFWFMMQIGMIIGYFTSYPMTRLLVQWGLKEAM
jgi:Domain of unknown function (DUF4396)